MCYNLWRARCSLNNNNENWVKIMTTKNLQQGENVRIKETGQIVEVKQISDHGVALIRFRTGGEYLVLNDRLETVEPEEIKH